jgi:pSer/pThr/pTyr-binding forkhead associated (FHA) protein
MNYPLLSHSQAKELAEQAIELSAIELKSRHTKDWIAEYQIFYRPLGQRASREQLIDLRDKICDIANRYGFPNNKLSEEQGRDFDSEVEEILFQELEISLVHAAEERFWAFMSNVLMPDIVRWRFLNNSGQTSIDRFLTSRRNQRNTFGRLWWRRACFKESSGTAWHHRLLEDEVVGILERPSFTTSARVCQNLARSIYEANQARSSEISRRVMVREGIKRVRRLASFVVLEAMTDGELSAIFQHCFGIRAQESTGQNKSEILKVSLIELKQGQPTGMKYTGEPPLVVGRQDFSTGKVDIDLSACEGSQYISRRQARFMVENAVLVLENLSETNVTRIDRDGIFEVSKVELQDGDRIIFGNTTFLYNIVTPSSAGQTEVKNQVQIRAKLEICVLDSVGELPQKSGLNWGWANGRQRNRFEAYIKLPSTMKKDAERVFGSATPGTTFIARTHDGKRMEMCLEGMSAQGRDLAKQISCRGDKSLLGRWIVQDCLKLTEERPISVDDLETYGRNYFKFERLEEEENGRPVVLLDFSV